MNTEDKNMERENGAPLLAAIDQTNPFKVPENYFDDLSNKIIGEIKISALSKINTFITPHNYFDDLSNQIINQINLEKIKNNSTDFAVPDGYFEDAKLKILNAVKPQKKSFSKVIRFSFIRYAAAACILLMTSAGIYLNIHQTKNLSYQLSQVPDEEIESYLKQHTDNADVPLIIENLPEKPSFSSDKSNLTDEEILELINNTP
ncbi:hypothetical protein I5M32_02790 [Pedobacter sp. SD-b]|uniref:Uncharacterized protein n=1 Tax=Pedobacter segetis TaxID=2793069 RepID=A0ABS1BG81_9SPHI|nr:hypothetical protein [Pedobacter segetis]MBK0381874.1 hypothetical protein [Pedobacter segetis]